MKFTTAALTFTAPLALTACTASEAETTPTPLTPKQAKLLDGQIAGKVAGEPVRCISNSPLQSVVRVSDNILIYRISGRLVYQNRLQSSCPGLDRDQDVIVSELWGSQQCRGDIIRLVDRVSGIPGGFCTLGDFVPYRKAGGS